MNIILINDFWDKFWWAEAVVANTQKLLQNKWHDVYLFSWWTWNETLHSSFSRYFSIYYFFKIIVQLVKKKYNIAHIHWLSRKLSPSILIPLKIFWIKVIYTFHDYHFYCPKTRWIFEDWKACTLWYNNKCWMYNCEHPVKSKIYHFFKWAKVWLHRRMVKRLVDDYIILNSHMSEALSASMWLKASKLHLLPNYFPWEVSTKSNNTKKSSFLYVWRISREKWIDVALHAVKELIDKWFSWILLEIIWNWPDIERLLKMINTLWISDHVIFHWRIENDKLSDFYASCQALLIPSVWLENNPLVALEAMWNGAPIIATDIGWLPDLVQDWINWFIFEIRNHIELSENMIYLMENIEKTIEFWENWKKILLDSYTKEKYYTNLISIYQQ